MGFKAEHLGRVAITTGKIAGIPAMIFTRYKDFTGELYYTTNGSYRLVITSEPPMHEIGDEVAFDYGFGTFSGMLLDTVKNMRELRSVGKTYTLSSIHLMKYI